MAFPDKMNWTYSTRLSRAVIAAVALFLCFDLAAFSLNVWLSKKIEQDAVGINLAGRQRMLTQRMAKVLLQLDEAHRSGRAVEPHLQELSLTVDLFDDTLQGFAAGHETRGGRGEVLFLAPVKDAKARVMVARAMALWAPYRELTRAVIGSESAALGRTLSPAVAYARSHNLELLELMNLLTSELESLTQGEASKVRRYQGIFFALALLTSLSAFALYGRHMRDAERRHDLLDDILNKVSTCVLVLDADGSTILRTNSTTEALFAYPPGGLTGRRLKDLVTRRGEDLVAHRRDGSTFLVTTERHETFMDNRKLFVETVNDVTQQRQTEEHLSDLAYHDLLTRLPNRLLFDDRLRVELARARRGLSKFGVLFVDLDRFKSINDTHGHETGDLLLQEVAARMLRCVRESDTVSRRGGDEFTVLVSQVSDKMNCAQVAENIIDRLEQPFVIQGQVLQIGASIGICLVPDDAEDVAQIMARADEAMYRAKQMGRGMFCFYR